MSDLNYIEAYIKYKKKLVILISGLSGCGKTKLGKNISRDFKIKLMNQNEFFINDYNKTVKLSNGVEVIKWDNDDAVDWDKFNSEINKFNKDGVIVIGFTFPVEKLKFKPDFHLHLSIKKTTCMEKRKDFFTKYKNLYPMEYERLGTDTEKLIMNNLTYPHYLASMKSAKIHYFISGIDISDEEIYNKAFKYLIDTIHNYLHKDRFKKNNTSSKIVDTISNNLIDSIDSLDTNELLNSGDESIESADTNELLNSSDESIVSADTNELLNSGNESIESADSNSGSELVYTSTSDNIYSTSEE
jgi:tRNA A37 threonylcarbamoyladenosine biosynthesis protein TsaE